MNLDIPFRLHRHIAKGSNQPDPDHLHPAYLCKVFLTFAPYALVRDHCIVQR